MCGGAKKNGKKGGTIASTPTARREVSSPVVEQTVGGTADVKSLAQDPLKTATGAYRLLKNVGGAQWAHLQEDTTSFARRGTGTSSSQPREGIVPSECRKTEIKQFRNHKKSDNRE